MPDKFDPYRERLVLETQTVWGADCPELSAEARSRISLEMHENPRTATHLEYVRTHTGFCRRITVTAADVEQLSVR